MTRFTQTHNMPSKISVSAWLPRLCLFMLLMTTAVSAQDYGFNPQLDGYSHPPVDQSFEGYGPIAGPENYLSPQPGITYEQLPSDRGGLYGDEFVWLERVFGNATFRVDYLNWSIREPDDLFLGEPILGTSRDGVIQVQERITGLPVLGVVPDLNGMNLDQNNGIRGVLTVPTTVGSIETSYYTLQNREQNLNFNDAINDPAFFGSDAVFVPTLIAGAEASSALAYDTSFIVVTQTGVSGAEANFVWNSTREGVPGLHWRPLLGLHFLKFDESIRETGVTTLGGARTTVIDSTADTNILGPQFGLRAELVESWFTLSVEPKLAFGFARTQARVRTRDLFVAGETPISDQETSSDFTPIFDLNLEGKVHLNTHFSLFVGYDLIFVNQISRAFDNIRLNGVGVNGLVNASSVNIKRQNLIVHGLSVGGELRF